MRLQDVGENHSQLGLFRRQAADGGEESHLSVVYLEGSAFGVQATEEQAIRELYSL